jgi:hypothetical protein
MVDVGWVHGDEDMVDGKHCVYFLHFCANALAAL